MRCWCVACDVTYDIGEDRRCENCRTERHGEIHEDGRLHAPYALEDERGDWFLLMGSQRVPLASGIQGRMALRDLLSSQRHNEAD